MQLTQLKRGQTAIIQAVTASASALSAEQPSDRVQNRLTTLGFVPGEPIKVLARGLFGGDPILVQLGLTRFALRRTEAMRIEVQV